MPKPKVGVAVFIFKGEYIAFQKRISSKKHGDKTWSLPGGKLEYFEKLEECAKREVFEEVDLKIKNLKFIDITNDFFKDSRQHYITIFFKAKYRSGTLKVKEKNKCSEVKWVHKDSLPKKIFLPLKNIFKKYTMEDIYKL